MQINYFCIYVLFVDIFTRSLNDFISMKFLIALFLPVSPLIPTSLFINFGDFCQPLHLLHPPRLFFGQNLPASPFTPPHPPFYEYLLRCSGSWIYLPKVSSRDSRAKYQICFQLTAIEQCQVIILVSFLLTFNRFHTLCWGFYC